MSTMAGCRTPDIGLSFTRKAERSSDSDSSGETRASRTYGNGKVLIEVIVVTSPTMWQKNTTIYWNKYGRTEFPKYLVVHWKGMGNKVEGCLIVESLQTFSEQAVDAIVASGMEDAGV